MQNPSFKSGIPDWIKEIKSSKPDIEKSAMKVEKKKEVNEIKDKNGPNFLSFPYIIKPITQSLGKGEIPEKRKCEEKVNTKFYKEIVLEENQPKIEKADSKVEICLENRVNTEEILKKELSFRNEEQGPRKENKQPLVQLSFEFISNLVGRYKTNKERVLAVFNEVIRDLKVSSEGHESLPKILEFIEEVQEVYTIKSKENEDKRKEKAEKYERETNKFFKLRKKIISTIQGLQPDKNDSAFERNLIYTKKNVGKTKIVLEEVKQELNRFIENIQRPMLSEPICEELEVEVYLNMIKKKKDNVILDFKKNAAEYFFKLKQRKKEKFEEFLKVAEKILSLNRSFKFEEVVNHYESLPHRASLKETQQYYYAKLHQKLEATHSNLLYKPAQINTIPVNLIKQNSISDHFYNILTAAVIVFLGYTTYKSYSTDIPDLSNINITFKDVKGIDECREELEEVVDLLKNRKKYQKIGAKVPKGILLVGKPGTGKTLLAKAIAGEAGVKFIACSGSEFDEIFVGVGAKKVRTLFENAKKVAPAIIFIDEIDAVGGTRRGRFGPGPHQQTLNQLLVEMDGFDTADNIIVIGATNIPDGLDEALKRPGRFDKIVDVPVPNLKSRTEILDLYLSKIQIDSTVTSEKIAQTTTGFTGADLANLVNTGMLTAIKAGRSICSILDIETAKDRILLGVPNRSLEFTEKEKLCLAIHEIGHVLAILYTQGSEDLHKTSILLRGSNYGKTSLIPNKEQLNITRKQALANLDVLIAGRVMQELMLPTPDISTQCEKDLIQANNNANTFVTIGLFNELFGLAYIENKDEMGPETRNKIDSSVQYLLQESYKRVKRLLQGKLEIAKELSVALAQRETMSKQEVIDLIDNFKR